MAGEAKNILFLCTGNSARSILAECLCNHLSDGRYKAYSAGSHPKSKPHPMALKVLEKRHIATDHLTSKSWDEFARPGAPQLDLVVTVCDNAAAETCPVWPGAPIVTHWGLADPAKFEGSSVMMEAAFDTTYGIIERRLKALLNFDELPSDKTILDTIGDIG
jgi:arsenate reductase (thioredoxin)